MLSRKYDTDGVADVRDTIKSVPAIDAAYTKGMISIVLNLKKRILATSFSQGIEQLVKALKILLYCS